VVTLDLDTRGIPVVGDIPKGLPSITITLWTPLSNRLWVRVLQYMMTVANAHFFIANSSPTYVIHTTPCIRFPLFQW
jgi:hypothetical protein